MKKIQCSLDKGIFLCLLSVNVIKLKEFWDCLSKRSWWERLFSVWDFQIVSGSSVTADHYFPTICLLEHKKVGIWMRWLPCSRAFCNDRIVLRQPWEEELCSLDVRYFPSGWLDWNLVAPGSVEALISCTGLLCVVPVRGCCLLLAWVSFMGTFLPFAMGYQRLKTI